MKKKSLTTLIPTNGKVSGKMMVQQNINAHLKKLATVKSTIDNKPPQTMRIKSAPTRTPRKIESSRSAGVNNENANQSKPEIPIDYEDLIDKDKKKFTESAPFTPRILKSKTQSKLVENRKIYNPTKVSQKNNKTNNQIRNDQSYQSKNRIQKDTFNGNNTNYQNGYTARSTNSDQDFKFNDDFEIRNGLNLNNTNDSINYPTKQKENIRQDLCYKFLGDVAGEISMQKISSVKGMKQVMEQNMRQNKYNMTKNELSESYNIFLKDLDSQNAYPEASPNPPTPNPQIPNDIPNWIRQTQQNQHYNQDLPQQNNLDFSMSSMSASIKPTPAYANHSAAPDYFQTSLHSLDETTDEINLVGSGGGHKELIYENRENRLPRQNSDFSNGLKDTIELREHKKRYESTELDRNKVDADNIPIPNHRDNERNIENSTFENKDEVDLNYHSPPNRNVRFASTNDEISPNHSLTDISSIQPDNNDDDDDDVNRLIKHDDDDDEAFNGQLMRTQPESFHMSQQLDDSIVEQYKQSMTIKDGCSDDGYEDDFEELEEIKTRNT